MRKAINPDCLLPFFYIKPQLPKVAKSEHSHPVWNVGIHPFSHENDHGKALKNGAYPFKSAKIGPKIGALPFS